MTCDEFIALLKSELDMKGVPQVSDRLAEDLGLDSVDMVSLVALIEECAGLGNSPEGNGGCFPILTTVREAYEYLAGLTTDTNGRAPR